MKEAINGKNVNFKNLGRLTTLCSFSPGSRNAVFGDDVSSVST